MPIIQSRRSAPECLPEIGPTHGWRCHCCCGAANARHMASTLTLKRQTTFAIELMFVLRISMLPRDDTQNERNNKKRLSGCPREPILGSFRRRNNLNHRRQLNDTTNSRYLRVFLTSVGRTYDLAALDTLRDRRFAYLRK